MSVSHWCRAAALISAAALTCAAQAQEHGHGHKHGHEHGHQHHTPPEALALVSQAEAALSSGDAVAALALFEQAAARWHAPDIEAGWVRAQMQAGDYRGALAFAAHVAGAHPREALGSLLYAWLLQLGGQTSQARLLLDTAQQRWPNDAAVARLRARLLGVPMPAGALLPEGPEGLGTALRLGPYATGAAVDAHARVVASGLSWGAQQALVPLAAVNTGATLWVRDGLGNTRRAVVERSDITLGLTLLRLEAPLDAGHLTPVPQDAFPGSPAFALAYRRDDGLTQWPQMSLGFLGAPVAGGPSRQLGFELPQAQAGGPVLDRSGRLLGISLAGSAEGQPRYVPLSAVLAFSAWPVKDEAASAVPAPTLSPDQLYESGLRATLLIIAAAPG
jgi:tetratricopeptide (TPR) repeat protein